MSRRTAAIVLLYAISGGAGLAWQVLWVRAFVPVFGAGLEAISAVTATFMLGLGLGGALAGRVLAGRSPLRSYALLEAGVGLWGAAMPWLVPALGRLLEPLLLGGDPLPAALARIVAALLLVAPPATALGLTFPAVAAALDSDAHPHRIGLAYGVNALGAAGGALLAGLWLPWALGLRVGALAIGAGNLLIAALAWSLSRDRGVAAEPGPTSDEPPSPLLWVLAGLTGFTGLALEVTWSRLSGPLLAARFAGDAVAFAGVLAAVLLGIGLGGVLTRRVGTRASAPLAVVQALLFLTTLAVLEPLRELLLGARRHEAVEGLLPLIPALLLGATFPLLSNELMSSGGDSRRGLGRLYAVNTAGAVIGSLAAGFVLIPWLGAQRLAVLLAGLAALTATIGLARAWWGGLAIAWTLLSMALCGWMLWITPPVAGSRVLPPDEIVLDAIEGRETSTLVSERPSGERALTSGGHRIDQAGGRINDHALRALGPAGLHPAPRRVLAIGLGTGETARNFLSLDAVESLTVAELDETQARLLPWFGTEGILDDPRLELVAGDGRHLLRARDERFEVISVDAWGPRTASAAFYTADFYAEARARLAPGGLLFVKFNPASMPDQATLHAYVATALRAAPHAALVYLQEGLFGLVVSEQPLEGRTTVVADADSALDLLSRAPSVTDDHPMRVPNLVRHDLGRVDDLWSSKHAGPPPWTRRRH